MGTGAALPFHLAPLPAFTKHWNCVMANKSRYKGKGVLKAVENVNTEIAETLYGWGRCRTTRN